VRNISIEEYQAEKVARDLATNREQR
jgi:hypothetical protein